MPDANAIVLAAAAFLFVIALIALTVWAFKSFVIGHRASPSFLRPRDKRLGLVEVAPIDGKRKLILVRRDDVEHLVMIGGPVDMLIESGIQGRRHLEPPLEDVIIARTETRPAPDYGKT